MKSKTIYIILLSLLCQISVLHAQDDTFEVIVNINENNENKTIKGEYSIWYGERENEGVLMKPFIICEGFDPLGMQDADLVRRQVNEPFEFVDNLIDHYNYDVFILDLDKNTMEIEKNAVFWF